MRRLLAVIVATVALLSCCGIGRIYAQRCLPGTVGIGISAGFTDRIRRPIDFYTDAVVSIYSVRYSRWTAGVGYRNKGYAYRTIRIPQEQFTVSGGYRYCCVSDRSKTFFLYIGGSAIIGYETVNRGNARLYDGATLRRADAFIYGLGASLEAEAYLCDRMSVFIDVEERCLWGGCAGKFHTRFGAGLRIIIN